MIKLSLPCLLLAVSFLPAQEFDPKKVTPGWNLTWEEDWVTAVTFVPNSRRLVAGNEKGEILVWDLPEKPGGKEPLPVRHLKGHTNGITKLRTTPDGRWVISASKDKTVRYWDMQEEPTEKGEVLLDAKKRETTAKKNGKAFPPMPPVKVKVQTAKKVLDDHKDWVLGLALTHDGKTMITGDDSGTVRVWDREEGKLLKQWKTKGWVHGLAISPDAKLAVVTEQRPLVFDSGRHTGFKVWDVSKGEVVKDLGTNNLKENYSAAAFSPDGKRFAVARSGETDAGTIYLFQTTDFKKLKEWSGHKGGCTDLQFSASGKYLLSSGRDTTVRVWNVDDGKMRTEFGKPRGGQFKDIMHAFAVSSDQQWVAGADMAGLVQVWHVGAGPAQASAKKD